MSFYKLSVGLCPCLILVWGLGMPMAVNGQMSAATQADLRPVSGQSKVTHLGRYLSNPLPPYPPISIECKEEGTVVLNMQVEANGQPSDVKIVKSSGYRRLDVSAYKTVRDKYRFIPAYENGVAIAQAYKLSIRFVLPRYLDGSDDEDDQQIDAWCIS